MEEKEEIEVVEEEQKPIVKVKRKKGGSDNLEHLAKMREIKAEKLKQKKAEQEELQMKLKEIEEIKKKKLDDEYEEALKIKKALEKKKKLEEPEIKQAIERKEQKQLIKAASRDILKDKYLEEAKKRVMMDLFS
jgi:hypothetical protein